MKRKRLALATMLCGSLLIPVHAWAQHGGHGGGTGSGNTGPSIRVGDPMEDVRFLSTIGHHVQHGVDLAMLGQEKASRDDVRQIAAQLAADGRAAADRLHTLQGGAQADHSAATMSGMSGMAGTGSPDQVLHLERLRLLEGPGFDAAFLQILRQHHEGVIRLAKDETHRGFRGDLKAFADETKSQAEMALKAVKQAQKVKPGKKQ